MSTQREDRPMKRRIPDFYDGKSLFITGAAGYLGVILLEILLRTCPGIESIYILLREKKGIQPECRKDVLFKRNIFYKLKEKRPEAMNKVHVVAGDISLPNLGMTTADLHRICKEVSIVFHCAASISFLKPLKFMISHNAKGTYNIIELCRKLKHLDALVYTSTAYSNSNRRSEIEEMVYRLPFPAHRFLEKLNNGNDYELQRLVDECQPSWPNYYTFSKCLAENILLDYASDLPVAIVRPSIIVSCWKGVLPGYIEEGSGMVDLGIAVGKGFVRAIHGNPNNVMDFIPVDVVANTHVAAAWSLATNKSSSPFVVNCTSRDPNNTLQNFHNTLYEMALKHPLPKSFQRPSSTIIQSSFLYWVVVLFEHYIPAVVIDSLLRLNGRKPRLMALYRFYDKAIAALNFFLMNTFYFQASHFKTLSEQLETNDKEMFYVDITDYNLDVMASEIPYGSPFYEWGIDKKPMGERRRITYVRYLFTSFIKTVVLVAFLFLLYFIASKFILYLSSY